jgi:enhancer of mRNA-decapping protein 4
MSPSPSRVAAALQAHNLSIGTQDENASFGGDDLAASLRSFPRSSPTSSMQAFNDEASQQYEPSIGDDTASDAPGQQTILSYLRRMEANQIQREEQFREQMRTSIGNLSNHLSVQIANQVDKSIGKQIQSVLVPAMGRIVLHTMENNFMKPVQAGFQRVISEKIVPHLETKINASLSTILPEQLENGMKDFVDKITEEIRDPVRESFRECFQAQIIPSFQAATQKMFVQINDSFLQGTKNILDTKKEEQNQLQNVQTAVEILSKKIDQLAHVTSSSSSSFFSSSGTSGFGGTSTFSALKEPNLEEKTFEENKKTVKLYLAAGNFEEAFKLVRIMNTFYFIKLFLFDAFLYDMLAVIYIYIYIYIYTYT